MTFQAYTRARRLTGALQRIREGAALDPTIFDSGYASHSGFRDAFTKLFGKTPRAARSPQQGDVVLLSWVRSPLGPLVTGATEDGVCLVEFSDRRMLEKQFATISRVFSGPIVPGSNRHSEALARELSEYFAGTRRHFDVPIVSPGSPFQRRVWEALMQVPYGQTCSYQDIATAVGDKKAVRAVGTANGANRIAIVIPCHRVVNKGGKLGGYGGGLWRKQYLIDLERGDRLC
jgi:AraC family transcriptional regulator of adaptative response/methylated-DNA-[protein]-cysteine methyltransferase